ncbi:hypothetical protein QCA50_019370 [Cerrena zonata]|uniref:Uncharacterized protein n=1 Tax=Cerrena zonata TaxID=2478898 RepID=A0AAW0FHQ9_9APHY
MSPNHPLDSLFEALCSDGLLPFGVGMPSPPSRRSARVAARQLSAKTSAILAPLARHVSTSSSHPSCPLSSNAGTPSLLNGPIIIYGPDNRPLYFQPFDSPPVSFQSQVSSLTIPSSETVICPGQAGPNLSRNRKNRSLRKAKRLRAKKRLTESSL